MRHVIIGNSAAGISALEAIREHDKESKVVVISDEPCHNYSRVFIHKYISGELEFGDIPIRGYSFYDDIGAKAILGKTVVDVIPEDNAIRLLSGEKIDYDNLLIATGACPSFPDIPGIDKRGVKGLRTFEDAFEIAQLLKETNSALVVGGGLIGVDAAEALVKRGVDVTIVELLDRILPETVDLTAANIIQRNMAFKDVKLFLNTGVKEVYGGTSVQGVELTSGEKIECGIVIMATGAKPNIGFVANSGIEINRAIKADSYQRTNIPNIFAAGDAAECYDLVEETESLNQMWPNAVAQGRVAGANMAGCNIRYDGGVASNTGSFFGINVASVGRIKPKGGSYREISSISEDGTYRKIVIHEGRIVGALLVGDVSEIGVLYSLICQRRELADFLTFLERGRISFAHVLASLIGK